MRRLREQKLSTNEGWGNALLDNVATMRNEAVIERLRDRWGRDLADSPFIPLSFEVSDVDPLARATTVAVKQRDEQPLSFDMNGGEKLELARYLKAGRTIGGPNYGLAFHITEMQVKGNDPQDNGKLVEHPWVMVGSTLDETKVTPLEKKTLQYGEENEIVKWLALFNPKDIDLSQINFSNEDYPKLVVLAQFGISIAERTPTHETTLNELRESLTVLRQMEILSRTDETVKPRYDAKLAETNAMRDAVMQNLTEEDDLTSLFHPDYLSELFGDKPADWVNDIYAYLQVNHPMAWPPSSWQAMMESPDTHEAITDEELEKIKKFLVDNNLAINISTDRMATNPFVYRKMSEFAQSENDNFTS